MFLKIIAGAISLLFIIALVGAWWDGRLPRYKRRGFVRPQKNEVDTTFRGNE